VTNSEHILIFTLQGL